MKHEAELSNTLEDGRRSYMRGNYSDALNIWLPLAEKGDQELKIET